MCAHVYMYIVRTSRGDSVVWQSGGMSASLWMDNKEVLVMSTNTQPGEEGLVKRIQRDSTCRDVTAPTSVISYNRWMGGVDRGDQLRQYYHLCLKSRKFYKYIFWFLVDVSITNTYILHKAYGGAASKDYKSFRLLLAKALIGCYSSRKRPVPRTPSHLTPVRPTRVGVRHFPMKHRSGSKKGVSRCWYCAQCKDSPVRKETVWYCTDCECHLCHTGESDTDCFLKYHMSISS